MPVNGSIQPGTDAGTPAPEVTVAEAVETTPQPTINNENHTKPKRTRKGSTELVLRQGDDHLEQWRFMPVMSIDQALERRQTIVQATQKLMREGVDYGKIPGAGDKPALLQPGADKLCNLFGLVIRYEVTKCEEDWTGQEHDGIPFFFYELKGRAYRGEFLMGEGLGSCNAWESKYKYRCRWRRKTGPFWRAKTGQRLGYAMAFSRSEESPGSPAAFYFDTFFAASASAAC